MEIIITEKDIKNYTDSQYIRDRKIAYEQLNQFDLQFNDLKDKTTTWQDAIEAIKFKYPKPE